MWARRNFPVLAARSALIGRRREKVAVGNVARRTAAALWPSLDNRVEAACAHVPITAAAQNVLLLLAHRCTSAREIDGRWIRVYFAFRPSFRRNATKTLRRRAADVRRCGRLIRFYKRARHTNMFDDNERGTVPFSYGRRVGFGHW